MGLTKVGYFIILWSALAQHATPLFQLANGQITAVDPHSQVQSIYPPPNFRQALVSGIAVSFKHQSS